jgi:hypothetical protein
MQDPIKRDEQSGGQRNADSHTNSGQKTPEQQTSSGAKSDAERKWSAGRDATGGDTPLDAGGSSSDVEGAEPSGAVSTNREREKPWQVGGEDAPDAKPVGAEKPRAG